jgi:drug/metabolite transporter (DMT)-like permease
MLTGASVIILPIALVIDGVPQVPALPTTWAAIAYFGVIGTAVAYLLYYRIIALAGSGNAMIVTLLIPPVAIVLGALVLGERLNPQAFFGFGLLAFGLLILDGRLVARLRKA